ncbi:MAG TPA: hypothetical protein VE198_20100 [Actinoallomurus sp.]|nr:hypothetical protein [Actinoallomurus sp.]
MTRLESSAWSLAGGSACVFALAVVLGRQPWQVPFVVVILAVLGWAWLSPVVAGAAIGGIAWLCVTGFDVHRFRDVRITGRDDVLRVALLVLAGVLAAAAHALAGARSRHTPVDPLWAEFHGAGSRTDLEADTAVLTTGLRSGLEFNRIAGDPIELRMPRQRGIAPAERPLPAHPTEEPSDG